MTDMPRDIFTRSPSLAQGEDLICLQKENLVPAAPVKTPLQKQGPDLSVSPTYHDFMGVPVFMPRTLLVTFSNNGNSTLRVRNISTSNYVFASSAASLSIPPGESRTLRIVFTPYAEQTYYGSVSFQTNDPDYSSGSIYLTGRGVPF